MSNQNSSWKKRDSVCVYVKAKWKHRADNFLSRCSSLLWVCVMCVFVADKMYRKILWNAISFNVYFKIMYLAFNLSVYAIILCIKFIHTYAKSRRLIRAEQTEITLLISMQNVQIIRNWAMSLWRWWWTARWHAINFGWISSCAPSNVIIINRPKYTIYLSIGCSSCRKYWTNQYRTESNF